MILTLLSCITHDKKGEYSNMGANLMYNPLERLFESTIKREGKTVTAYTSGNEFKAFMRRNDDGNNFEDRITLFYPTTAPVVQGSIVSYGNKLYILVNRETEENDCYYKSSGLACNGMITLNDGMVIGVPCYAYNMNGSLVDENQIISVIDGNMEFITESNSLSRQIKIGNKFNEFGRTFKVNNIYYKDGILHLVTEVTTDEQPVEHLNIIIDGLSDTETYNVGDSVQLTATLYINNTITTGTVTWESTNTSVATIDGNGLVSFISDGTVAFKAYWVEKDTLNTSDTIGVGMSEVYYVIISGNSSLWMGFSRTYTATLKDKDYNEQTGTWEWSYEFAYPDSVTFTVTDNKVSVKVEENDNYYGEILTIIAHETTHDITATKEVEVTSF